MSKRFARLIAVGLISSLCFVVLSCAGGKSPTSSPSADSASTNNISDEFPMTEGTTWVYSYVPYEPLPSDPTQVVTATFLMTETVMETAVVSPYFAARIRRETSLMSSTPLTQTTLPGGEFWYVVSGTLVFEQGRLLDLSSFDPDYSRLAYDLPLDVGKQWCPIRLDLKNPDNPREVHCESNGMRTVAELLSYQTPAGKFEDCYKITEAYVSGGVTRWFCNGIGVVAAKYDHGGTRFGFEQILINYSPGSP